MNLKERIIDHRNSWYLVILVILTLFCAASASASELTKRNPVIYTANGQSPQQVVENIVASYGYSVRMINLRDQVINSKFSARSLSEMLDSLGKAFGFEWFFHSGVVYLYGPGDWGSAEIKVEPRDETEWKDTLSSAGLYIEKFAVLPSPERNTVTVNAPKEYIRIFKGLFELKEKKTNSVSKVNTEVMVFKLKHASVEDRSFSFRGAEYVTPGVVSVLRGIYFGIPSAVSGQKKSEPSDSASVGQGLSGLGTLESRAANRKAAESRSPLTPNSILMGSGGVAMEGPTIQGDSRTNSVIVKDDTSKRADYQRVIDQLDVPLSMIEIEATLIDIDRGKLDEIGAQILARGPHLNFDFPSPVVAASDEVNLLNGAVIRNPTQFLATIRALAENREAKVLARPMILTQDNLAAFIDLTETFYVQVTGERVADLVPVTAGSLLRVLPRVVSNPSGHEIVLQVDIQDGSLQQRDDVELPTVKNNTLSTEAIIAENQAILIGGYNRESSSNLKQKIPLLGDIPLIGGLFRIDSTQSENLTRLFMITPRLVSPGRETKSVGTVRANIKLEESFPSDFLINSAANGGLGLKQTWQLHSQKPH